MQHDDFIVIGVGIAVMLIMAGFYWRYLWVRPRPEWVNTLLSTLSTDEVEEAANGEDDEVWAR
jgi:hypothetical protein